MSISSRASGIATGTAAPTIKISRRIQQVAESLTLALEAKTKALQAEGVDVVGFGAGEPDFDTPEVIRARAHADLEAGATRYTPAAGLPELKQAICEKFARDNGLAYRPDQVIVSVGAKHSLYNIFQTLLDEGDEVILPAPYWLSYPEQIRMGGGKVVAIATGADSDFKIRPEHLEAAMSPRTVAFLINSPSNPTGMVYSPEEIRALARVVEAHPDVTVISDEMYEHLVYDGARTMSFAAAAGMFDRTITVNGMSKTYAMTGWRIGYCAGPLAVIKAMARLQSHSTSNPTTFCQTASITALREGAADAERMRQSFDARRKVMVAGLRTLPGVRCPEPLGAFYVFPDVSALYEKAGLKGSIDFCDRLLTEARVACVPGLPFGDDRCIRLSYATSKENIEKGLSRLAAWIASLG